MTHQGTNMLNRSIRAFVASLIAPVLVAAGPAAGENTAPLVDYPARADMPMDWNDRKDFEFAARGFITNRDDPKIHDENGRVVFDMEEGAFLDGADPATVHPSLLRQARVLRKSGLFEVVDGVYQVRGFDITNVTFIRGDTGWIIIDTALTPATARAALELANEHLGPRPVRAVIYTHSHIDHSGGAAGVISQADVDAGKVKVIAPKGFLDATLDEFVVNGAATNRRTSYAGIGVERGPLGTVSSGLGDSAARGMWSLIAPITEIAETGERLTVDGVDLVFQVTPGTEAPAEMNIYLPQFRVLDMAENANVTLHNVLSPRGVEVRDAKFWADELTRSIRLFGDKSDAVILSHGWPRFGQGEVVDYLSKHRDAYKFLHDQTVRMMNEGLLPDEIANRFRLPDSLAKEWYNRGYYGSYSFNARAVYQRYLGWYQGNPVDLQPLEPADEARRYVDAMGGRDRAFALARNAASTRDDRWASELLNRLVMADSKDREARDLLADVYTRMALEQENGIWRAQYLSAAKELREGVGKGRLATLESLPALERLSTETLLEMQAVRLDPAKVGNSSAEIDFVIPERSERIRVNVRNQVLTYDSDPQGTAIDATVTLTRSQFVTLIARQELAAEAKVGGSREKVSEFADWFTAPSAAFPIVWRPDQDSD
ncbi:MAG: alkyl sulfatase dimerization domain-containing protein [Novosphingobium sp.]|nr:MBL fold metallo-hydrolase [Novosphingobium sp.]